MNGRVDQRVYDRSLNANYLGKVLFCANIISKYSKYLIILPASARCWYENYTAIIKTTYFTGDCIQQYIETDFLPMTFALVSQATFDCSSAHYPMEILDQCHITKNLLS